MSQFPILKRRALNAFRSPISLFVASITLFLWRPIMEELADALPIGGAPYSYMSVHPVYSTPFA